MKRPSQRLFTLTCFILTLAAIFVFAFGKSDVQAAGQQTEIELGRTYTIDAPYIEDTDEFDTYILNGQSKNDVYKVTMNYISGEGICFSDIEAVSEDLVIGDIRVFGPISKYQQSTTGQFSLQSGNLSRRFRFYIEHPFEGMEGYDPDRDYEPESDEEYLEWKATDYLKGQTMKISFRVDLVPGGEEYREDQDTVKYKLTYVMNGGTNSADNPTWYTGTVKLKNPKTRKGCDFKGWYSDPKFKKRVKKVKNKNMTLYAKWEWHGYYISFKKNGGKGSMNNHIYRYGKEFTLPACEYTKKGYKFVGWNTKDDGSGKSYSDKAKFKNLTAVDCKTIKLYAQWKPIKYKITYKNVPDGAKNKNKTSYTIETATFDLSKASCPGYDFKGWYSDKNKTKKITTVKKGSTGNKTIYSKWTAHKYTVKFDANGGTGKMADKGPWTYGEGYELPKNSFKKTDYLFNGWNTQADGKGIAYTDKGKVSNLVTKDGGSITLYAQWRPKYVPRITLNGLNSDCLDRSVELLGVNMPNCTTYALARALEIMKWDPQKAPNYIPPFFVGGHSNAEYWIENNKKSANPLPTGNTPKVGAIAVWEGNRGHVAIVEAIDKEGHVYYSHSSYGGHPYDPPHPYPNSINDRNFHCEAFFTAKEEADYIGNNRKLLGYIYLID